MEDTTTATSTPSAPAASTPASTPASSSPTISAPVSAREALAQADASSATTASPDPAVATPAAAIAQPAATTTPIDSASTTPPEPPKWRWQDILENARKKTAEETEARIRQEVGSTSGEFANLSPDERAGLVTWQRALSGDPHARAHIAQVAKTNPDVAALLQGLVGQPATQPSADPMPEADYQTQDGTPVYSAQRQQLKDEWMERQLTAKLSKSFDEKLQPFAHVAQTFQQREQQAQAWTEVGHVLAEFRADPDFKAHEAAVKTHLANDRRLAELADRDPQQALEIAYSRVYRDVIAPAKAKAAEGNTLANLKQRAVAGTTNPAAANPTVPATTLGNARAALEATYAGEA